MAHIPPHHDLFVVESWSGHVHPSFIPSFVSLQMKPATSSPVRLAEELLVLRQSKPKSSMPLGSRSTAAAKAQTWEGLTKDFRRTSMRGELRSEETESPLEVYQIWRIAGYLLGVLTGNPADCRSF